MNDALRLFAFHLPQFHPIPENDRWWGKGFTEWTNTAKARPMFPGHYQPHIPADLGFYDLRVPETRAAQAEMARAYGIEGFCYYHYWFAGKRLLERPIDEILASGQPDLPFCLCWANRSWSGIWHGAPGRILMEQTFPGPDDHQAHFDALLPAFLDRRYARVDGKPIFIVYQPEELPDTRQTLDLWRSLAAKSGLDGLHLVGLSSDPRWDYAAEGFDATIYRPLLPKTGWTRYRNPWKRAKQKIRNSSGLPVIQSYRTWWKTEMPPEFWVEGFYPCVTHAWDNSPRSGKNSAVLTGSNPELFRAFLRATLERTRTSATPNKLVFLKSWNEWAEGNHLEPDRKFGHGYLQVIREELDRQQA